MIPSETVRALRKQAEAALQAQSSRRRDLLQEIQRLQAIDQQAVGEILALQGQIAAYGALLQQDQPTPASPELPDAA